MAGLLKAARLRIFENVKMTRRAQDEVDLTYITPRTIAMSFPATGYEGEITERNIMRCGISQKEDTTMQSSTRLCAKLVGLIIMLHHCCYYFKFCYVCQKNSASARPDALFACAALEEWLEANDRNVVVLHCLAGKGRTGLVIACQLFYTGQCSSMKSALRLFAERRSKTSKGVRQLSQLRYAFYLERALTAPIQLRQRRLRLVALTMRVAPAFEQYYTPSSATYVLGCAPLVEVYRYFPPSPENANGSVANDAHAHSTKLGHAFRIVYTDCQLGFRPKKLFTVFSETLTLPLDTTVEGDVLIKVLHHKERAMFNNRVEMFHCQFNTMFVDDIDSASGRLILTLPKAELNEAQNNSKFANSFSVTLEFEDLDAPTTFVIGDGDVQKATITTPPVAAAVPATSVAAPPVASAATLSAPPLTPAMSVPLSPTLSDSTSVVDHPLLPSDADSDDAGVSTAATSRARSRRAEPAPVQGGRVAQSYSELTLDSTLALMRKRFRERQRERAAAHAAALGDSMSDDLLSDDSISSAASGVSSSSSSGYARRRHVDPSALPPPLAPSIVVSAAAPIDKPADVSKLRVMSGDDALLALNRALSADGDTSARVTNAVGRNSTDALDLARSSLVMSSDAALERDVKPDTLKRSSDEPVDMRRSRSRTRLSMSTPPPAQLCELCQEAPAIAKLVLTNGAFVIACQSCSEARLASRSGDTTDDDDDGGGGGDEKEESPHNSSDSPVGSAMRAMSFIDLGDERRVMLGDGDK